MTSETPVNDEAELHKETREPEPPPGDGLLRFLGELATRDGIELGVTLTIGGFLVSGALVSPKTWMEGFAEQFTRGWEDQEAAANVREEFLEAGRAATREGDEAEEEEDLPPLRVLHLKNARFFHPGGNPIPGDPARESAWWRCRIASVDGFFLGTLGVD